MVLVARGHSWKQVFSVQQRLAQVPFYFPPAPVLQMCKACQQVPPWGTAHSLLPFEDLGFAQVAVAGEHRCLLALPLGTSLSINALVLLSLTAFSPGHPEQGMSCTEN